MLKVQNTLGRELQEFKPIEKNKIKVYQCGPTVYSRQHIGNLSSAIRGDLIRRSLEYLGFDVTWTRNITDVGHLSGDNEGDADTGEDRMAKGAKKEGSSPEEIAKKYTDLYHQDIKKLNVKMPDFETIATKYVKQMAKLVQDLIDRGFAYSTEKAIYFEVDKFDDYNKLNLQKLDENLVGAGHGDESDSEKKKPYDFAVWFFKTGVHKNALQTWEHKFTGIEQSALLGFPGWHIECSAMAKDTLGETIDIHIGGIEHIPIHHTNEIAQSEAANGKTFSNYWIHHELLMVDGGKMSKSIGNVYSLDDLEEKGFSPLDYRYFLLQANYRTKQNFTFEALEASKKAYNKLKKKLNKLDKEANNENIDQESKDKFIKQLENDFNIPAALSIAWEVLNSDLDDAKKYSTILDFDRVLGLDLGYSSLNQRRRGSGTAPSKENEQEINKLISEREQARKEKDYAKADKIRDRLREKFGFEVKDEKTR